VHSPKILVIRRDNIGDLVCTTPLFTALRARFPAARICALVNSYNVEVLSGNPDVDTVYAYTKAKHRPAGKSVLRVYLDRIKLFVVLRRERFDYAIIAGTPFLPRTLGLARMIRPRHIIGFTETGKRGAQHIDMGIPHALPTPLHETEDIFRLLAPLGISGTPPGLRVVADAAESATARQALDRLSAASLTIGIHISARKVSQRWPSAAFVQLIHALHTRHGARFMLFWSPGAEDNPLHPGDDNKAAEIMRGLADIPILAFPTHTLQALIGGLAVCDFVICSDGGAMHLAAALGKPIVCFFGKSNAVRWHPWGVPHVVLQTPSREVADIAPQEALSAFEQLIKTPGISAY
jgi:heptosyltransferase-3